MSLKTMILVNVNYCKYCLKIVYLRNEDLLKLSIRQEINTINVNQGNNLHKTFIT